MRADDSQASSLHMLVHAHACTSAASNIKHTHSWPMRMRMLVAQCAQRAPLSLCLSTCSVLPLTRILLLLNDPLMPRSVCRCS